MVQMRRELEAPRAAKHEIQKYRAVVHFLGVEVGMPSQAPGVLGAVAFRGRGEEGQVPVFGDVPVEGVEGVEEDGDEPVCSGYCC